MHNLNAAYTSLHYVLSLSTVHAGALVACRARHFRRSEFRVCSVFAMCVVCVVCVVCVGVRRVRRVRRVRGVRGELTHST